MFVDVDKKRRSIRRRRGELAMAGGSGLLSLWTCSLVKLKAFLILHCSYSSDIKLGLTYQATNTLLNWHVDTCFLLRR